MNTEWAQQWLDAFEHPEQALAMYAEDVAFEDVVFDHRLDGKSALAEFFSAVPGTHSFEVRRYYGDADAGVVEWTWHAVHAQDFLGVAAEGKSTDIEGVSILTFEKGKITSQRDIWDGVAALRQLGALG